MPGWPTNPDGQFNEADIAGHEVLEVSKSDFDITVGGMPGYDDFGDGSFYILDTPKYSLGHINALAWTSVEPENFIFLAADSVHLGGEFRPTDTVPLPDPVNVASLHPCPCPAEILLKHHPRHSGTLPFLGLDRCFPENLVEAQKTIERIQVFDADERVFVVLTHDTSVFDIVEFFPATADEWRRNGRKEKARWAFLPFLQKVVEGEGEGRGKD
jgi:hypothetical protein